tara:strand:+ start:1829 stop:3028 length:1200 start_codon:yes stop_codon:yes gene_type:complete
LAGVYRGTIEAVDDPEQRKRYRVRVHTVHPQEVPVTALPWAELSVFGGKFFGDLPAYLVGDRVFVMFEAGNRRFPVILGGFLSEVGGTPDAPSEVRSEYARTQQRWVRLDRTGNLIEMSPLPSERWIRIKAGEAVIALRQNDGSIEVRAGAQIRVTAPIINAVAAEEVVAQTKRIVAQVSDEVTVKCAGTVNIQGATAINIGRYENPLTGALAPDTSDLVDIRADAQIKAESSGDIDVDAVEDINVDTQADMNLTGQADVNIEGVARVYVKSDGAVDLEAGGKATVTATDNVEVDTQADVIVNSASAIQITAQRDVTVVSQVGNVSVEAQVGNVDVQAGGNVNIQATGSGTVESTGPLTLKSASRVSIEAPIIGVTSQAQTEIAGGSVLRASASLVTIG